MTNVVKFSPWSRRPGNHFLADFQLRSAFQPIFSPSHKRLVGYEALVRVSRDGKPVAPPALFERARLSGRTEELDRQLLAQHLECFGGQPRPAWLFLNITPDTCVHPDPALDRLGQACDAAGLEPGQVVLEVVETATGDRTALLRFVAEAKHRGFQIAIDDFGMGDSNFERMWQLEPLIVKIDRSLLVNAEHHRRARLLLESLVKMIRESGSLVLLEGIENEAQARIALATEADLLQGFLFGRPEAVDRIQAGSLEQGFGRQVDQARRQSLEDVADHAGYLRLLRYETLASCHAIMRRQAFDEACRSLLAVNGVKRCFLLNEAGVQQGELACEYPGRLLAGFNPLYLSSGACWVHREYFRSALERPHDINVSRPYVALPDAVRTVTLSSGLRLDNRPMVFCVDLHPDAVFDGQLSFPDTL
ncbi:MAG: EAL domain-containing protein [Marinobacter sp.]|uniref:EAL domain-containing protein n=1 Tax=Marinobacter sp. TaxID=50741 RepID=UPI00299E6C00|nr:EAL domain-containing protein [Marinobacter sp.]MDX1635252.1 EAL domain-containing protein [Marinobacter sp.]